jgi:ADP-dependent NAD(P)H-hydrate dehydratase / NAD(P)H-hydrate epimerase
VAALKVLTAEQMREADRLTTERYGVPSLELMENAGTRVVEFLRGEHEHLERRHIAMLCGRGNNGGDGLVVARLLASEGAAPAVYLFARPEEVHGDAAVNLKRWQEVGGRLEVILSAEDWEAAAEEVARAEIIVDALLGTGLRGAVEGLLRNVIEDVNRFGRYAEIVAVDIPSGLSSDAPDSPGPAIAASATVTFTAPKLGMVLPPNAERVGQLAVGAIGTPRELLDEDASLKLHWLEPGEFRTLPLRRRANTHKGNYGHVLVVGGSRGKTGAAVLAGLGALRAGAGLVTVGTPESVWGIVASHAPELMTEPLDATPAGTVALGALESGRFVSVLEGKNVLAIGPGLSQHPETQQFVRSVVAGCGLPVILDADGLNAFAGRADLLAQRKTPALAVTPHPGEMARLVDSTAGDIQAKRLETAQHAASEWNAWVILKGYRTILAAPDGRAFINSTGNPGMATGGTGDVLTGMLAGLTAQFGVGHWEKVLSLGIYLHGLAGDLAAAEVGEASLVASDLVGAIPLAFAQLMTELDRG